jgi:hypothetical protein
MLLKYNMRLMFVPYFAIFGLLREVGACVPWVFFARNDESCMLLVYYARVPTHLPRNEFVMVALPYYRPKDVYIRVEREELGLIVLVLLLLMLL